MTNALKKTMAEAPVARYGVDALQSHCEELNAMNWVRKSGRPFYVASKVDDDGVVTHFVDRKGG